VRRHCCRQCCRIPTARPAVCAAVCRSAAARCPVLGELPAGAPPLLPPTTNRALNPKPCPIAECSNRAGGTGNRCRGGHGPRTALGLLRVRLCTRRLSCPGRLPSTCTLEAHPPRGRPNGRPGAGRRCWAAAVAACGRGLQPATSRRRPGAGTRKGVPGRRKRRPPPGGRPRGSGSGSRRHGRSRPHPCSRRGGRHRKPRWPLSQAARAPPLCRHRRAARLTAGATSGRTASAAPGVPRAGADSDCRGGRGSDGQRGAAALASAVRGPWLSRVDNFFVFFVFPPRAPLLHCSVTTLARRRVAKGSGATLGTSAGALRIPLRRPHLPAQAAPQRSADQTAKQTTKRRDTTPNNTTTDNTQQTNNDKTQGTPERPSQEVRGGQGGPGRDHKFPWGTVVSDLAAKAARPEATTTQET
jgi:hypothetical protein